MSLSELNGQNIPNYDFYVGTWVYETSREQFTMKTKIINYVSWGEVKYALVATYKYVKNGVIIYDDLNTVSTTSRETASIGIYKIDNLPSNQMHTRLRLSFDDPITGDSSGYSQITLVSTNPPKILWSLKEPEGTLNPDYEGFTVPMEMILTKVE